MRHGDNHKTLFPKIYHSSAISGGKYKITEIIEYKSNLQTNWNTQPIYETNNIILLYKF